MDSSAVLDAADSALTTADVATAVRIADLLATHPDYARSDWDRHRRLYCGGAEFRAAVGDFLPPRPIERYAQDGLGARHREERLRAACYVPRGSGIIDWLVAAAFRGEPGITCRADDPREVAYWESLGRDADGAGRPLAQLCRDALLAIMLYGSASFYVRFRSPIGLPRDRESLDARLSILPAPAVEDWELDDIGDYRWIRLHTVELLRRRPETQPDRELHRWVFLFADQVVEYSAARARGEAWRPDTLLTPVTSPHDFGALPVFPIRAPASAYVMNRVSDILAALFARETALAFALNSAAYAIPIFYLASSDLRQVVASELAAIRLAVGEDAKFLSPPSDAFVALFRDVERLRLALYEALHSLALSAPAQTQNPRQSAEAKRLDRDPLETLLDSFAWPIRDALARALDAIARYRRSDALIELVGFERPERVEMRTLRELTLGSGRIVPESYSGSEEDGTGTPEDRNGETEGKG